MTRTVRVKCLLDCQKLLMFPVVLVFVIKLLILMSRVILSCRLLSAFERTLNSRVSYHVVSTASVALHYVSKNAPLYCGDNFVKS